MPRLKPQYEAFCVAYVANPNAGEAAESAGYERMSRYQQGYRLLRRADVSARVAELREAVAARDCASVATLLAKLETAFTKAVGAGNAAAAARVIELQARLAGYLAPNGRALPATAGADTPEDAPPVARPGIAAPEAEAVRRTALAALAQSRAKRRTHV